MGTEPRDSTAAGRAFRVLIVDDNHDAADSLAWLASLWGYEARAVYDGTVALEAARAFRPHCLVLDIGLPGMDGYTLAKQIRKEPELKQSRLVALSAYAGDDHQSQVQAAGFDYSLKKPADPADMERLLKMIQQALRLAQRTEALAQQNVELARETKALLSEVKEEIKEVKEELREVKEEMRDVRNGKERDEAAG
jgi:CheY-like chemotaxis protein